MSQEGNLFLRFKTSEDAQRALTTVKDVLKNNCENWYEYVTCENNQILIGDGDAYHIDVTEFESILCSIGMAVAIKYPEQPFSGYAYFSISTTGFECYDELTYDSDKHILFVRENYTLEDNSIYDVECDNCGEYVGIELNEYQGQTEFLCSNCGETVSLEGIEDFFDTVERRYLITNGAAEKL